MTQYYVGVKIIQAGPEVKDGKDGYAVRYPDGYISWSPKDVFEASYLPMGVSNNNKVTQDMVEHFLNAYKATTLEDGKTTLVASKTLSGFMIYETSSCVDPKNYDVQLGTEIALKRIKDVLWHALGFIVQWGKDGLK